MTDDENIRRLVRRAHDADPEQVEVDITAGLSNVRSRAWPPETVRQQTLTVREREALEVIQKWMDRFGYPPSVREIGEAVGLSSTSSVAYLLRALERKGYLHRDPNRPRTIGIPHGETDMLLDPLPKPGRNRHGN